MTTSEIVWGPCEFPEAQFVWGTKTCDAVASHVVVDSDEVPGQVCEQHFRLIMQAREEAGR